jgi:hypothetical protein
VLDRLVGRPVLATPIESCVKMWIVGISMIAASRSGARP